jgi:hypothetical protein
MAVAPRKLRAASRFLRMRLGNARRSRLASRAANGMTVSETLFGANRAAKFLERPAKLRSNGGKVGSRAQSVVEHARA